MIITALIVAYVLVMLYLGTRRGEASRTKRPVAPTKTGRALALELTRAAPWTPTNGEARHAPCFHVPAGPPQVVEGKVSQQCNKCGAWQAVQ
jgi:hypothetical protein